MQKKNLGNTSVEVSELCLGTMYFGTKVDEFKSFKILDRFVDLGGNFIDTANNYCWWIGGSGDESENLIGKWMKLRNNRSDIVLASKIGARPIDPRSANIEFEGLRKETIISDVNDSLSRLKTDYIDLCYIHADFEEYPLNERLEALYVLESEGKIRFSGCSNIKATRVEESKQVCEKKKWSTHQAIQQKFSRLLPDIIDKNAPLKFLDDDMIRYAEENNTSILTYSVLLSGAYNKGYQHLPEEYASTANKETFNLIVERSKELSCTPSQYVLMWVKKQSEQIIPLVAASSIEQLDENISALNFLDEILDQ